MGSFSIVLAYPVATYAKSEPDYYLNSSYGECNWCGNTWIPTNYMIFHGLVRYGFLDAAKALAYRTLDLALANRSTREYYNSETGEGLGCDPFYGWSSLAYLMPLEYELGFDPPEITSASDFPEIFARGHINLSCVNLMWNHWHTSVPLHGGVQHSGQFFLLHAQPAGN